MKAYQIKYQHNGRDVTYVLWKIAKSKQEAFKFAFGKSMPRNENRIVTKRGLPIVVTEVNDHVQYWRRLDALSPAWITTTQLAWCVE